MKPSLNFFLYLILALCISFSSCHNDLKERQVQKENSVDSLKEHMINANKIMIKDESKDIEDFIERHQWKMNSTGTGLRYEIYLNGSGKQAGEKKQVSVSYSLYLLDGTLCYSADEKKPLTFILGIGEQTHGMEEGISLMHEGDKARLVVPSHLGYGMPGDDNKVPGNSSLYYDVTLLKVNDVK